MADSRRQTHARTHAHGRAKNGRPAAASVAAAAASVARTPPPGCEERHGCGPRHVSALSHSHSLVQFAEPGHPSSVPPASATPQRHRLNQAQMPRAKDAASGHCPGPRSHSHAAPPRPVELSQLASLSLDSRGDQGYKGRRRWIKESLTLPLHPGNGAAKALAANRAQLSARSALCAAMMFWFPLLRCYTLCYNNLY